MQVNFALTHQNMDHLIKWSIKSINELSATEYHRILALRTCIFVVEQDCPYQEADDKDLLSYHVYGLLNGTVVAVCRIIPPAVSYSEISIGRVAVAKKYRGTNVGNELMIQSLSFILKKWDTQSVRISAQEHLQKFYSRFGFKTVSYVYLEDNIPHVEMLR